MFFPRLRPRPPAGLLPLLPLGLLHGLLAAGDGRGGAAGDHQGGRGEGQLAHRRGRAEVQESKGQGGVSQCMILKYRTKKLNNSPVVFLYSIVWLQCQIHPTIIPLSVRFFNMNLYIFIVVDLSSLIESQNREELFLCDLRTETVNAKIHSLKVCQCSGILIYCLSIRNFPGGWQRTRQTNIRTNCCMKLWMINPPQQTIKQSRKKNDIIKNVKILETAKALLGEKWNRARNLLIDRVRSSLIRCRCFFFSSWKTKEKTLIHVRTWVPIVDKK